ncbi:CG0192-related protein [Xylanimonas sp. McL0601]|uniref:CG0192-related protein n=1 Tax=Xylanimonas sp. McL0601 TaxID=3414739 RepID=UPI003CF73724
MAIIHRATLTPTKLELLEAWLPSQPWFPGGSAAGLERVAAFRFDDPAGEVGVETLLVRTPGGPLLQVPLTYRGAPLEGGEAWLVGTMQHSALGPRWVYDAEGDPVYVAELTRVIREGDGEVEQFYDTPQGPEPRPDDTHVHGSGGPAAGSAERGRLTVVRVLDGTTTAPAGAATLTGTWADHPGPALLATLA